MHGVEALLQQISYLAFRLDWLRTSTQFCTVWLVCNHSGYCNGMGIQELFVVVFGTICCANQQGLYYSVRLGLLVFLLVFFCMFFLGGGWLQLKWQLFVNARSCSIHYSEASYCHGWRNDTGKMRSNRFNPTFVICSYVYNATNDTG